MDFNAINAVCDYTPDNTGNLSVIANPAKQGMMLSCWLCWGKIPKPLLVHFRMAEITILHRYLLEICKPKPFALLRLHRRLRWRES